LEAISTGSSSAARRAKELCAAAARVAKEAEQAAEANQPHPPGTLSVEAVAQLTAQAGQPHSGVNSVTGGPPLMAREGRKASTVGGPRGFIGKNPPQVQQSTPPGTPPTAAPIGRRLSVSASVGGEDGLFSCVLPEDLLVELIAERMLVRHNLETVVNNAIYDYFLFLVNAVSLENKQCFKSLQLPSPKTYNRI
jgi:hydrocephalus-inducing protein